MSRPTSAPARKFDDRPAVREKTPILVGLVGPSGSGKTFSALRLAAGFQRVTGGETFFIDTEARRSLHYAKQFSFRHVAFGAPFSPIDYLEAIEHCLKQGATTIVIDSMSHEHEGPGGVLEEHETELDRMAGTDWDRRNKMTMVAWAKPKAKRRRLINSILQMQANFIFCFRAKKKLKIVRGKEPEELGYQPIAGEEFVYEMTMKALLLPGANGVPAWVSDYEGEKAMMKLPDQFRGIFASKPQLTEDIGEALARWGAGDAAAPAPSSAPSAPAGKDAKEPKGKAPPAAVIAAAEALIPRYEACSDPATFRVLQEERAKLWKPLEPGDLKSRLAELAKTTEARLAEASAPPPAPELAPPTEEEQRAIAAQEASAS